MSCNAFSQDVWLQNHFSPISGCALSNSELVNVLINNNSGVVMPSNTINVTYTIDNGPQTNQLLNSNLFPGASWNFNFNVNADLSGCGQHTVKVWVTRAGDVNHLNDTLQWNIQNDCPIVPGTVLSDTTVCESGNSGTLQLAGWFNGTILEWQYSQNNGTTWVNTGSSSPTYTYTNLTTETQFYVIIDGGACTKDTSGIATVSIQSLAVPGSVIGSDSMCITAASGALNLAGASGLPLSWEYSTNNGTSWSTVANTTTTYNYNSLLSTTIYRVLVDGGACPDVYSDTGLVYVEQLTDPATLTGSTSLCITSAAGVVVATGNIGDVSYWQYSTNNGTSWSVIPNTTTTNSFSGLTDTTWYRVFTDGGFCPSYYSDTAIIIVQPEIVQPGVSVSDDSICASNGSGSITLTGAPVTVLNWEKSTNNGPWVPIASTATTYNFTGLTQNTRFRAKIDGGVCNDIYSDTAVIAVSPVTDPGVISTPGTVCVNNVFGFLTISGNIGPVMYWEYSEDFGATWTTINNTSSIQNYTGLADTTWYRAYTNGFACPSYFTDTGIVNVDQPLVQGTIDGSDMFCEEASGGSITLSGNSGTIAHWESSVNGGASWNTILNNTETQNYNVLTSTTLYRVLLTGSFCGNIYSDTAVISIVQLTDPGTLLSDHQLCPNDTFNISLVGYTANAFQWESSLDGVSWSPVSGANGPDYTVTNVTQTTWYQVVMQNGICPPETSNDVTMTLSPPPYVDAGVDVQIMEGDSILLIANGGGPGIWFPGLTLSDSLIPTPIAFPLVTTTYMYNVTDANGCVNQDSVTVTVIPSTLFDIKNVISANHDNYNDSWIIEGLEYFPDTRVVVFNIYGKEVYKNDNYQNDWNGTFKDQPLPNGTYYYTVIPGGTETMLKGNITIMGDE